MPPSGYSVLQVNYIGAFLTSCSEALLSEADELGLTEKAALKREIVSIDGYSQDLPPQSAERAVLTLTREFYETWFRSTEPSLQQRIGAAREHITEKVGSIDIPIT